MSKHEPLPPLEEVRELINYDPATGLLTWKQNRGKVKAGDRIGHKIPNGYMAFGFNYTQLYCHRVAYYLHYGVDPGEFQVDHENQNRSDNRIENLRLVTQTQNQQNRQQSKGFYFSKRKGKYISQIIVDGVKKHLGSFDCPLMAHLTYRDAKAQYHII